MRTSQSPSHTPEKESVAATPRATIADVARAAGVSRTTVSYVLSERPDARVPEATRRRIVAAAETVGYRRNALAAAIRSGRINSVGILFPPSIATSNPVASGSVYYKDMLLEIATAAFDAGLNPLLMSDESSRRLSMTDLTDRRVDGVILAIHADPAPYVETAQAGGIPCVTIGRDCGDWQVHADNNLGARLAVEHLQALGHRRIGFLWYGKSDLPSPLKRRETWRECVRAAGIPDSDAREFLFSGESSLLQALRDPQGPTAIFCYNDELAFWLLELCRDAGVRVPEDISVVGYDNNVLAAAAWPRLTTIHNPLREISKVAIELFQAQLRGEDAPPPVLVAPSLVIRQSTAPPRESLSP